MPQNSNFRLPRGHPFSAKKMEVTVIAPNHVGDPLGSILGPMGSHWVQKMGQNVKNYHAAKFELSTAPRSSIFRKQMEVTVIAPNYGGTPMGFHTVQKMGQNRKKLPCPKIRIFDDPAVIDFSQKMEVKVLAPIKVGTPSGPSWGQWRPIGSKELGQNVENYHAQNSNFWRPLGHPFFPNNGCYGYSAKSR